MPETILITVNGHEVRIPAGISVAAALGILQVPTRTSVSGEPRGPLCTMGVCYECRVNIDGVPDRLACQTFCVPGMEVSTIA